MYSCTNDSLSQRLRAQIVRAGCYLFCLTKIDKHILDMTKLWKLDEKKVQIHVTVKINHCT